MYFRNTLFKINVIKRSYWIYRNTIFSAGSQKGKSQMDYKIVENPIQ